MKSNSSYRICESIKNKALTPAKFIKVLLVEDNSHNIQTFVEMMQQL